MRLLHRKCVLAVLLLCGLAGCAAPQRSSLTLTLGETRLVPATDDARERALHSPDAAAPADGPEPLSVHFIDVGQGDCTLIACPNGAFVLVDGGSTTGGFSPQRAREYLLAQLDPDAPRVDALVITHPDADHYNVLEPLLEDVQVGHIYHSGPMSSHSVRSFDSWLEAFDPDERTRVTAGAANIADPPSLGDFGDVDIRILASNVPDTTVDSAPNTGSIVLHVRYGAADILLTGDATRDIENDILGRLASEFVDVEVLKLGHHGSNTTSTSEAWAAATSPEVAIASAGWGNHHGHPHRLVIGRVTPYTVAAEPHAFRWSWREGSLARFEDFPAFDEAVYSTATSGDIVVTTDGATLTVSHAH